MGASPAILHYQTMPDRYDIFLSYPSVDRASTTALKAALEALGLSVWMDAERIDDAASIQSCIESGLACSRVLVAWYSKSYAQSRACQWELTAALIVSQTEQAATKRVLVINPEVGVAHIVQTAVKDIELISAAGGEPMAALAQRLQVASGDAQGLLGDIRRLKRPRWYGQRKGLGSNRFVGRLEELWHVQNALTNGRFAIVAGLPNPGASVGLASVRGSGGMGKSLLAEEYALRFGAFWPGGIFWLDALGVNDRPEEAPAALAQRRESYHLEQLSIFAEVLDIDSQSLNLKQLRARMHHRLEQSGEPYLWVVDDLPVCDRATLDNWLAPSANGVTLVISRARQHDALGTQVELGILQPDDAYALLCREHKPHDATEEAAARRILQRLGGHAMAVDQARAACAVQGFTGFLARLDLDDKQALALSRELAGDLPNGHERDIAKTFLSSIDSLTPEGLDLLTLATQLSNAPISRELVAACKLTHDRSGSSLTAAQDWTDSTMGQLVACTLADFIEVESSTPGAPMRAIILHTLIARVARWRLAGGAETSQSTAQWHQAAVRVLRQTLLAAGDIRQYAELLYEVQHARQLCERVETVDQVVLLEYIAAYDHARGHYAAAREGWERVLLHFERKLGPEHPDTLRSMSNLARTHSAMGEHTAARTMQEQLLALGKRVLGDEHPSTLINISNMASTLCIMGDYTVARAMQEQVLVVSVRVLGEEHRDTLGCLSNLAITHRFMGEYVAARTMEEKVLALRQRVLGEEHPDTLVSMNNMVSTLNAMGEYAAALVMGEQVLAVRRRVLGEEHPDTLTSINNVANTVSAMGEQTAARAMQEHVLAVRQRVLGEEHPDTLTGMSDLANTLSAMGEHTETRTIEEKVLAVRQRVQGEEHPDTLVSMGNLALTLSGMGHFSAARAMQEQLLAIHLRVLGEAHPDTLSNMSNLGLTQAAMGDHVAARDTQTHELALSQPVLGEKHPHILTSMNNLAATLRAMGDLPASRAMQGQVLALSHRTLGPEHPNTVSALGNLLRLLADAKDEVSVEATAKLYPATLAKFVAEHTSPTDD